MLKYLINWQIDVGAEDANTPYEAAVYALNAITGDPKLSEELMEAGGSALCFSVKSEEGEVYIDLSTEPLLKCFRCEKVVNYEDNVLVDEGENSMCGEIDWLRPHVLYKDLKCPMCKGLIPNNAMPGAYPGALSRRDNKTEICSSCGTIEALQDFNAGRLQ